MKTPILALIILSAWAPQAMSQTASSPPQSANFNRLRDRGDGVPSSIFGTYIRKGEVLVYPFFEYYRDHDFEYEAFELGFGSDITERFGRYRAKEGLIFLGYGLTDDLAFEIEAAVISATLDKAPDDTTPVPPRLEESGLGDVEAQLRWRWRRETQTRPELFSYFETTFPLQRDKVLIGTQAWEFKLGVGVVRGLRWGTITGRLAVEFTGGSIEPGEYAVEYLRRINRHLRVFAAVEGSEDEVEAITELQVFLANHVYVKLNNAFGVTKKATDWAPEVGIMFVLNGREDANRFRSR